MAGLVFGRPHRCLAGPPAGAGRQARRRPGHAAPLRPRGARRRCAPVLRHAGVLPRHPGAGPALRAPQPSAQPAVRGAERVADLHGHAAPGGQRKARRQLRGAAEQVPAEVPPGAGGCAPAQTGRHRAADLRGREGAGGDAGFRRHAGAGQHPLHQPGREDRPGAGRRDRRRSGQASARPGRGGDHRTRVSGLPGNDRLLRATPAQDHRQPRRVGIARRRRLLCLGGAPAHHDRHDPGTGARAGPVGGGEDRGRDGCDPARRGPGRRDGGRARPAAGRAAGADVPRLRLRPRAGPGRGGSGRGPSPRVDGRDPCIA